MLLKIAELIKLVLNSGKSIAAGNRQVINKIDINTRFAYTIATVTTVENR